LLEAALALEEQLHRLVLEHARLQASGVSLMREMALENEANCRAAAQLQAAECLSAR
jgi:hypothetical protein